VAGFQRNQSTIDWKLSYMNKQKCSWCYSPKGIHCARVVILTQICGVNQFLQLQRECHPITTLQCYSGKGPMANHLFHPSCCTDPQSLSLGWEYLTRSSFYSLNCLRASSGHEIALTIFWSLADSNQKALDSTCPRSGEYWRLRTWRLPE